MTTPSGSVATGSRVRQAVDWIAAPEGTPIQAWRRRILGALLLGVCVFAGLAAVVGISAALKTGQTKVIVVDVLVYGGMVGVTLGRRLPYSFRAGALVVTPAVMGCFFLFNFGFSTAGFPWVLSAPVFAGILLGTRAGLLTTAAIGLVLAGLGALIPSDIMPWTATTPNAATLWWVSTSSVLMLAALMAVATGYLFDGLGREVEAREMAVQEAERRERLAALGTLTGGIAHDFNNLLQPIVSDAENARRLLDDAHPSTPLLDDILRSAHRARTLVRRILSFARPTDGEREVVDLGALVHETERLLRAVLPATVRIESHLEPGVLVLAEAAELQQVLLNLTTNAAHAMPRGGTVTISLTSTAGGAAYLGTPLAGQPRVGILTVSDTGAGMDEDTLNHAFDPFFTTKQPGRGTGLGLTTVRNTVTQLHGLVHAESQPGHGTAIRILLPLTLLTPATPADFVDMASSPRHGQSPAHVVVVDDEPAVLLATSRLVERFGYQVTRLDHPQSLLDQLDDLSPPPAVVLTDLSMPGLGGWELAAALHARRPTLPVIVMTGNLEDEAVGAAGRADASARAGIHAVLSKPFTAAELRAALESCPR